MKTDSLSTLFQDPGPFASVYVEVSRDADQGDRVAGLAVREAIDELTAQGAPEEVTRQVQERLDEPTGEGAPISRCVVASERGILLDRLVRRHRSESSAAWGRLPDITALLADLSTGIPFVLCVVDHEGADVSSYSADGVGVQAERSVGDSSEFEQNVKGGGWSQARFQRSAQQVWRQNAEEGATEVERQVRASGAELVVIAGDERSRGQVADALPKQLAEVVVLDRAGRAADGGDDALLEAVEEVLREQVVARNLGIAHELSEHLGQGRAVAHGLDEVAAAFVQGQVDRLLLDQDAIDGLELVTAAHPGFSLGAIDAAGVLPAGPALVAAAVVTSAEVSFAGKATLQGEPVAALLRWDSSPTQDEV
jgi:hypothetical protein